MKVTMEIPTTDVNGWHTVTSPYFREWYQVFRICTISTVFYTQMYVALYFKFIFIVCILTELSFMNIITRKFSPCELQRVSYLYSLFRISSVFHFTAISRDVYSLYPFVFMYHGFHNLLLENCGDLKSRYPWC